MLETKEQKQTLLGAGVLVLILAAITLASNPNFRYKEPPASQNLNSGAVDAQKYLQYVQNLKIDSEASQAVFEKILTQADIKKEVENELQVNQTIIKPQIDASKFTKSAESGRNAVMDYLAKLTGSGLNFNTNSKQASQALFSQDINSLYDLKNQQDKILREVLQLAAPGEAAKLQESTAKAFTAYGNLIEAALAYAKGEADKPWARLYHEYAVINEQFNIVNAEVGRLSAKYNIADLPIQPVYAFEDNASKFHFIKRADAFLGIGDVTITVGDIPSIIKGAIEEGLTTSFANFMGAMLNKLIAKIESNYMIANFLYYTDALVAGQYTDDYLQKYVQDTVDRQIIKRFIPQFTCGQQTSDLAPIFQAKAREFLGFDVGSLRPSDPDYYQKLARIGDPLSFSVGWEKYYEGIAAEAETEAEKAAERELISPGLKTPRDTVNSAIAVSVNNIVSASRASLNALMNLGIGTAKNFISGFVSQLTQNLVNKFVFRGAVAAGQGSLGVLKEQKTCLAAAQLQPVLPLDVTTYQSPPPAPTQEELLEQECAKYPRGCTVLPTDNTPPVTNP